MVEKKSHFFFKQRGAILFLVYPLPEFTRLHYHIAVIRSKIALLDSVYHLNNKGFSVKSKTKMERMFLFMNENHIGDMVKVKHLVFVE